MKKVAKFIKKQPKKSRKEEKKSSLKMANTMLKKICIFGGASAGDLGIFEEEARRMGTILAEFGIRVSYGGGNSGIMGAVAATASDNGSPVVGILPDVYAPYCGPTYGKEIRVGGIPERLTLMYYNADAFIALPGGVGTLEEIFTMMSKATLVTDKKPIGLLNTSGFFNDLLSFLDNTARHGFMSKETRGTIISAETPEDLIGRLRDYKIRMLAEASSTAEM